MPDAPPLQLYKSPQYVGGTIGGGGSKGGGGLGGGGTSGGGGEGGGGTEGGAGGHDVDVHTTSLSY